jgi:ABC-2 type transport system permease protein
MAALIHSEVAKVLSVRRWWVPLLVLAVAALVIAVWNCWQASLFMRPFDDYLASAVTRPRSEMAPEQVQVMHDLWARQSVPRQVAAHVYTSGQFVGLLGAALAGVSLVTSEYHYRTLGVTFLVAPRRPRVVAAKLVAVLGASAALWLAATAVSLVVGAVFLAGRGGSVLNDPAVLGAIGLNLLTYGLWGLLGFGLGVLVPRQTAAAVTVTVLYLASSAVVVAFQAVHEFLITRDVVLQLQVLMPGVASQVLTTPGKSFPESPPQWVGGVVLLGYSVVATIVGTRALARRDV